MTTISHVNHAGYAAALAMEKCNSVLPSVFGNTASLYRAVMALLADDRVETLLMLSKGKRRPLLRPLPKQELVDLLRRGNELHQIATDSLHQYLADKKAGRPTSPLAYAMANYSHVLRYIYSTHRNKKRYTFKRYSDSRKQSIVMWWTGLANLRKSIELAEQSVKRLPEAEENLDTLAQP